MPERINAEVVLCMAPYNGIHTPMESVPAVYGANNKGEYKLTETGGKKQVWEYNERLGFKMRSRGKTKILGFYDSVSKLQLSPDEVMKGEQFSRIDVRNAISGAFDAQDHLRNRYKIQQNNAANKVGLVILVLSAVVFIVAMMISSNIHIAVSIVNSTAASNSSALGGIGKAISGATNTLIP